MKYCSKTHPETKVPKIDNYNEFWDNRYTTYVYRIRPRLNPRTDFESAERRAA